ncbi:hypothetical protein NUW58_g78 [Xylaria curta]|uniref:Uncharacterized protein n=2 Tax=Xylaria curta TaxID=42375 RepID=A0ACC1PIR9_9PEZI|nr:hypothetical protein NUW58_g1752 [Xylaria curta]KAJ2999204.1 hypothetical protein NUW58_g78 [Xylaria curta]
MWTVSMGDPARALLFRGLLGEIERLDLVNQTAKVGQYLYGKLEELSKRYPGEIENLRGKDRGTFIAWDSPHRDHIIKTAKQKGVNMGGSGERSIRLRPMLIFEKRHGMSNIILIRCHTTTFPVYLACFRRPIASHNELIVLIDYVYSNAADLFLGILEDILKTEA